MLGLMELLIEMCSWSSMEVECRYFERGASALNSKFFKRWDFLEMNCSWHGRYCLRYCPSFEVPASYLAMALRKKGLRLPFMFCPKAFRSQWTCWFSAKWSKQFEHSKVPNTANKIKDYIFFGCVAWGMSFGWDWLLQDLFFLQTFWAQIEKV